MSKINMKNKSTKTHPLTVDGQIPVTLKKDAPKVEVVQPKAKDDKDKASKPKSKAKGKSKG